MSEDFEKDFADIEEQRKRFELVTDFMNERLSEIYTLIEEAESYERPPLQNFYDRGMEASTFLLSGNNSEKAKAWLEEYKQDLALRVKMPTGKDDTGEVIDAIISTIDQPAS